MNRAGALAERLVVPSRFAWEIAGDPADLVCVEPTTVVTAALRRLGMGLPDEVIVVGVGAQGLLMSLVLVERGVRVKVLDPNADRVASAVALGAEPAASADADARFGLVVDTVGSPASIEAALERADVGATLLLLGLDSRPMGLTAQAIVRKQLVIRGSLTYDHPGDFEASIAAVNAGLAPGRIVTDAYALEDAQLAFDRSASTAGKTWIRVDQTS
jgi:alcohol dehydrogenase/L-iditol 2-dehydrogenase